MKASNATWLYCIVRSPRAPSAALRGLKGVPGSTAPRAVDAGKGLWLIVGHVPRKSWSADVIEAKLRDLDWLGAVAMGHEAVVERFVSAPALLPSKLFTLFHDDGRALAHVDGDRKRIGKLLDKVARRAEFGVRIALDEVKALKKAEAEAKRLSKGKTGAGFLMRKKRVQEVAKAGSSSARNAAISIHRALAKRAVDSVRKEIAQAADGGASRLLLDAAYLVDAKRAAAFRREAKAHAKKADREGLSIDLTGPWPAYHFATGGAA